jgi:uncharacterized membrane protein HdeD (DUF308 family)
MNKEEILKRSRQENKNKDLAEMQLQKNAYALACGIMSILAGIFMLVEALADKGLNLSYFALILTVYASVSWYKYAIKRQRNDLLLSLLYTIAAALCTLSYLISLFR